MCFHLIILKYNPYGLPQLFHKEGSENGQYFYAILSLHVGYIVLLTPDWETAHRLCTASLRLLRVCLDSQCSWCLTDLVLCRAQGQYQGCENTHHVPFPPLTKRPGRGIKLKSQHMLTSETVFCLPIFYLISNALPPSGVFAGRNTLPET